MVVSQWGGAPQGWGCPQDGRGPKDWEGGGGDPKDWEVLRMRVPQKRILHPPKVLSRGFFSRAGAEGGGFYSKKYIGGGRIFLHKDAGGGEGGFDTKMLLGSGIFPQKDGEEGILPHNDAEGGGFFAPKRC